MSRLQDVEFDIRQLRTSIEGNLANNRERAIVLTKLDELELWLTRCAIA